MTLNPIRFTGGRSSFRFVAIATYVLCVCCAITAHSQSTPNWGASPSSSRAIRPAAAASAGPGGGVGTASHTALAPVDGISKEASAVIPSVIAQVLRRPDTDLITMGNGQRLTVKQIRAMANARAAINHAIATGMVPAGRHRGQLASVRAARHDELLGVSKTLRDTSRQEAATAWAATPETPYLQASRIGSEAGHSAARPALQVRAENAGKFQTSERNSQTAIEHASPPGIALVNRHPKGVQFTPGGLYTIIGSGFGGTVGEVDLIGRQLPGGRLPLQVTQWNERQVQAQLPDAIVGVADQAVTLRVTTRFGSLYSFDAEFFATRQAITIMPNDSADVAKLFAVTYGNPADWNAVPSNLVITRSKSGDNIVCPAIGQDTFKTQLPAGWSLTDFAISSWYEDQSDPNGDYYGYQGSMVFSGSYAVTESPSASQIFVVRWGVLRSHSSSGLYLMTDDDKKGFGWFGNDGCISGYGIQVTLVGPAGLRPF